MTHHVTLLNLGTFATFNVGTTSLAVVSVEDRVGHVLGRPHEVVGEAHVGDFRSFVQRLLGNAEAFQLCNGEESRKDGSMTHISSVRRHTNDMMRPHTRRIA